MAHIFVRIPEFALAVLPASHVATAVEFSVGRPTLQRTAAEDYSVCGFTEWTAEWGESALFVGWDWGMVKDAIVVLKPAHIRSNVLLVADDGGTHPPSLTNIYLLEWIESLPWRAIVAEQVFKKM
jgi:hypothetical protein